jgi:hypothetical protein
MTTETGSISDGYHTFDELYEHRHALFLNVMQMVYFVNGKTWVEIDPQTPGWFLAGFDSDTYGQVSYHLPMRLVAHAQRYVNVGYIRKPYDGYTSADVLERLQRMAGIFINRPEATE